MLKLIVGGIILVVLSSAVPGQCHQPPRGATALFQEASHLQNTGKFAEAATIWRQFVREHATDAAVGMAYQGLGPCLLETGELPAAIEALNQALKSLPPKESGSAIRWNLAVALYRQAEQSKTDEHRQLVTRALRDVLSDKATEKDRKALAQFYLARTEKALGNTVAAKKQFEQLLTERPDKSLVPSVLLALAGFAEDAKDWPMAESLYRDFLRDFADHDGADEARLGLAEVQLQGGKLKEAEVLFGQLAKRQGLPAADYAHFRWAELAELQGEHQTAAERWIGFLEMHPKSLYRDRALLSQARLAVKLKQPGDAVKSYMALLESKSALVDADAIKLEAVATAFAAADLKHGLEWTDQLVKDHAKSPSTSQAQLQAARFMADNGKLEEALERSRWVLKATVAEAQPMALHLAGHCAMKLRKFDEAIAYYQTCRDRYPQSEQAPLAAYSLGVAFESKGALTSALTAYQEFLKRHGDHALADQAKKRVAALSQSG